MVDSEVTRWDRQWGVRRCSQIIAIEPF